MAGDGALTIDPGVVMVNGDQTAYTGEITLKGGSELKLNTASAFNHAQGITLTGSDDTLTFGSLSQENAAWTSSPTGTASVALAGAGKDHTQAGADVTLSGNNSTFAGLFQIDNDATLQASQAENLGTANIIDDGTLVFNNAQDWLLANTVTGSGLAVKKSAGTLSVGASMSGFSGITQITAGSLVVGEEGSASSELGGDVVCRRYRY